MIGRTGIKPHGKKSRPRATGRSTAVRLPLPGTLTTNLAVILGIFALSVGVGAGLGKWSSARDSELPGTLPLESELEFTEVNYSPLLGLGGPVEFLLESEGTTDEYIYDESLEQVKDEGNLKKEFYVITAKDSLFTALQCFGISRDVIVSWIQLAKPYCDLARLKPGQSFWLYLDQTKRPVRFEFEIDRQSTLVIERGRDGFAARKVATEKTGDGESLAASGRSRPVPGWVNPKNGYQYFQGTVSDSFYSAAVAAGMTPSKVMALIRVFGGLNFDREVKPGDHFRVLVAPGRQEGEEGPILAAMVEARQKPRYRFRVEQGKTAEYYNEKGEGGRKPSSGFICPVRGARISSSYSASRFHPILHCYRPHFGIDYAAGYGTPVRASASGVVVFAGWRGGFGRAVDIRHGNGSITSQYAHLSGFGPGVSVGKSIKQGAVVGYIGATGLATGPHLDYRIFMNGEPVNPSRVTIVPAAPSAASQKAFTAARDRYLPELKRELPLGPALPWTPPPVVAKAGTD